MSVNLFGSLNKFIPLGGLNKAIPKNSLDQFMGPHTGIAEGIQNKNGPGSDVQAFLNFLADPLTQIPLQSNFLVIFDDFPSALTNKFPANFENRWNTDKVRKALMASVVNTQQTSIGARACLFAQGFTAPFESVDTERQSSVIGGPTGGLLAGIVSTSRKQYGLLDIAILETNSSFSDFVLRPWIALVGHYGLNTRGPDSVQNVKIGITGVLFDKNNKNAVRKVYRFTGCAPVNIEATDYAYGNADSKISRVSFAYNTFSIDYQL